jgi:hypothetical protein
VPAGTTIFVKAIRAMSVRGLRRHREGERRAPTARSDVEPPASGKIFGEMALLDGRRARPMSWRRAIAS